MNNTQPLELLRGYLGLPEHQQSRLQRLLTDRPLRWSELADLGHSSPVGRRVQGHWHDIRTPQGFLGVRQFIGGQLLLEEYAAAQQDDDASTLLPLLTSQLPIRHLRRQLTSELLASEPVQPWPALAVGDGSQLVMLPIDQICLPNRDGEQEPVAALGIQVRADEHGPALSWAAWGISGSSWSESWAARPDHTNPCSRLAWGIVALQHQEPEELAALGQQTGVIRSPRERPEPTWIEPPRRYIRESHTSPAEPGGHVRAHWRQAHAHRYWTGAGRKKQITRWIPAIWVDPKQGDCL